MGFPHALEMVERIEKRRTPKFDVCVLGDAPSLLVFNNWEKFKLRYVMPMPCAEQRVLAPMATEPEPELERGEYSFIKDRVSTLLEHMETMESEGRLSMKKVGIREREPHEFPEVLASADKDQRVLAWSPHWQVYVKLGLAREVADSSFVYYNMLFAREGFFRKSKLRARMLPVLVRDAWGMLRRPDVRERVIESIVSDEKLTEAYWRFCGLHRIHLETNRLLE